MQENTSTSSLAEKREMFLKIQKERGIKTKDKIIAHERKERIPVSYFQEEILNAEISGLYDPDQTRTVCPYLGYIIKGKINIPAFHKAIQAIVKRHEILRTIYKVVDNQLYQVVNEAPGNILKVIDLENLSEGDQKSEAGRITEKRSTETFSLLKDPLMLTATLITGKDEHVLYISTDHIATDGLAMGILQAELLTLYQSYSLNIPISLPELPVQFSDFAIWERERFSGDFLEEKLAYWRQLPDKINSFLPYDHKREKLSYDGGSVPIAILPQMTKKLKELCRAKTVTMFTVLYGAFMELIYIFSGYKFNFSTFVAANRTKKETENLIGCFIDFQFLLSDFEGNPTFLEVIERTNKTLLKVYDNYVPFGQIPDNIPTQDFRILFQLQTFWDAANKNSESKLDEQDSQMVPETESSTSKSQTMQQPMMFIPLKIKQPIFALFPLEVMLSEAGDTINGNFIYNESFYNRSTILNLTNDYIVILTQVINNPNIRMSELKMKPHKSVVL